MSKQTALEYAEAQLAKAIVRYEEFEETYGENLEDVYEMVSDMGNSADAYEKGEEHGGATKTVVLMRQIIALLKEGEDAE